MTSMQTRHPFFDEVAKAVESATSLAQAAGAEARTALRAQGDRLAVELDLVRRDEVDAMRAVLQAQIDALNAEIATLKGDQPPKAPPSQDAG